LSQVSTAKMESKKKVLTSIIEYLESIKKDCPDEGNIDTAIALIQGEFDMNNAETMFENYSYYPTPLNEIFEAGVEASKAQTYEESLAEAKSNPKFESFVEVVSSKGYFDGAAEGSVEYLQRHAKLIKKFKEKTAKPGSGASKEELEAQAEDLKFKGNAAINAKNYEEAVKCYTEALALSSDGPNSHVYHSNRAAAYCYLTKYQEAVDDCEICIGMCPDYVKAHSRLGLCYFFLEQYENAISAYERAAELEPDNKAHQDSLKQARNKLKKAQSTSSTVPSSSGAAGNNLPGFGADGMPNIPPGMLRNPAMKQALDSMGGTSGLANLMKDPQMMAMAQQMMKDPKMMQQAMSMLGGGGGGGGMPDMSALASMMGGMGGMGAGGDVPSSSSKGKKPFRGFEDDEN